VKRKNSVVFLARHLLCIDTPRSASGYRFSESVAGKKTWHQPIDKTEDAAKYLMDKACEWTQKRICELGL